MIKIRDNEKINLGNAQQLCFHVYAKKLLFVGENGIGVFRSPSFLLEVIPFFPIEHLIL